MKVKRLNQPNTLYNIPNQSCGLCPNPPYNVPHPSNTCYDRYSPWDCRTMCNGYQREMCKKTCGLCSMNG